MRLVESRSSRGRHYGRDWQVNFLLFIVVQTCQKLQFDTNSTQPHEAASRSSMIFRKHILGEYVHERVYSCKDRISRFIHPENTVKAYILAWSMNVVYAFERASNWLWMHCSSKIVDGVVKVANWTSATVTLSADAIEADIKLKLNPNNMDRAMGHLRHLAWQMLEFFACRLQTVQVLSQLEPRKLERPNWQECNKFHCHPLIHLKIQLRFFFSFLLAYKMKISKNWNSHTKRVNQIVRLNISKARIKQLWSFCRMSIDI